MELAQSLSGRTVRLQVLDPETGNRDPMHPLVLTCRDMGYAWL